MWLHADELKTEIAQPVEESVKLHLVFDFAGEDGVDRAGLQGHPFKRHTEALRSVTTP